jgi:hypothetical protein
MKGVGRRLSRLVTLNAASNRRQQDDSDDESNTNADLDMIEASFGDGRGGDEANRKAPKMPDPTERNPSIILRATATTGSKGRKGSKPTDAPRRVSNFNKDNDISKLRSAMKKGSGGRRLSLFGRDNPDTYKAPRKQSFGRRLSTLTANVKNRIKKTVVINQKHDTVKLIEMIDELTPQTIFDMWFSDDELRDFKVDVERSAAAVNAGEANVDARGLEHKTEEGEWNSYKARKDASNAVLDEFDRQMDLKVSKLDDEAIRTVYLAVSTANAEKARKIALSDEIISAQILADTKKAFETWKQQMKNAQNPAPTTIAPVAVKEPVAREPKRARVLANSGARRQSWFRGSHKDSESSTNVEVRKARRQNRPTSLTNVSQSLVQRMQQKFEQQAEANA